MSITTSLAACSTTVSNNGPDGSVDAPSTLDDAIRYALSFIATLRDTRASLGANTDITSLSALVSINGGSIAGTRNRIQNGDFRVAQRGTSGTAGIGFNYTLDRWALGVVGAAVTWSQVTGSTPFSQSESYLQINGAASNTSVNAIQRIESQNCRDLAGKTIAVGYWVYQSTGVSVNVTSTLSYATATDNFSTITGIATSAGIAVPNATWTFVSGTFAVPNAATTGLQINCYAQGTPLLAGQVLAISRAQLEPGATATVFEQIPVSQQIYACQRYFEKSYSQPTAPGTVTQVNTLSFRATSANHLQTILYKAPKRTMATVTVYNPNSGATGTARDLDGAVDVAIAGLFAGDGSIVFSYTSTSGNHIQTHWTASAEL